MPDLSDTIILPVDQLWGAQKVFDDTFYLWKSSSVRVWFRRNKRRFSIGSEYVEDLSDILPELSDDSSVIPESLDWHNCVVEKSPTEVTILPVMPDKPILFNLETPILLHSGTAISVYIEIRSWLRFIDSSHSGSIIYELPTVQPHKAWFGPTTTDGSICYWRREKAAYSHLETSGQSHLVVCPVTIYNRSVKSLNLDVIYLPVSKLSVFSSDKGLVTDRVQVTYAGENEVSQVRVSGKAPPYASSASLLSNPREIVGTVESVMAGALSLFSRFTSGDDNQV